MPHEDVMPGTLKRSSSEAQGVWMQAYDNAVDRYGAGHHARLTAFAALKCQFDRVGDRWEPKGRDRGTSARAPSKGREEGQRTLVHSHSDSASQVLLYLAERLGIERADGLSRSDVVEAVSVRMGLSSWVRQPAE